MACVRIESAANQRDLLRRRSLCSGSGRRTSFPWYGWPGSDMRTRREIPRVSCIVTVSLERTAEIPWRQVCAVLTDRICLR